ncbi:MAG: type II and III secretion system protein [Planctomycetes bacterium]|nr:type II and III secretion system protein [Planctomycetota bacterium]
MRHHFSAFLPAFAALLALPPIGSAQVVQQPTFSYTTAATTVLVPDRGEVLLGGINRAQDSRSEFGVPGLGRPFRNVGISQSRGASTMSVKAYIHDFEAMDEALLAEAARRRGGAPLESVARQSSTASVRPLQSVTAIERQREAEADANRFETDNLLAKAQSCEAKGQAGVARLFYNMVAKQTKDPQQRDLALQRIAALKKPVSGPTLASSSVAPR